MAAFCVSTGMVTRWADNDQERVNNIPKMMDLVFIGYKFGEPNLMKYMKEACLPVATTKPIVHWKTND
jgi:hypothetical protein